MWVRMSKTPFLLGIARIKNQVKFMNILTEHILQCNQLEPLADASGRIVDLMNENECWAASEPLARQWSSAPYFSLF